MLFHETTTPPFDDNSICNIVALWCYENIYVCLSITTSQTQQHCLNQWCEFGGGTIFLFDQWGSVWETFRKCVCLKNCLNALGAGGTFMFGLNFVKICRAWQKFRFGLNVYTSCFTSVDVFVSVMSKMLHYVQPQLMTSSALEWVWWISARSLFLSPLKSSNGHKVKH